MPTTLPRQQKCTFTLPKEPSSRWVMEPSRELPITLVAVHLVHASLDTLTRTQTRFTPTTIRAARTTLSLPTLAIRFVSRREINSSFSTRVGEEETWALELQVPSLVARP